MRRDPLFYKLFQQSLELLFDLIGSRPNRAADYRFDSVAVKEPKFEIDGVFLPPETDQPGTIYFCEVQMQKDEELYERLFSESALYFYRNSSRFSDWQAVIIYPSRAAEQSKVYPHRSLLNGEQVHRVYLNEFGAVQDLPIAVGAIVLTIVEQSEAAIAARELLARTEQEALTDDQRHNIIDIVTSIMVYKFTNLSRAEIRAMLGLDLSEEPRAIREAKEEGRKEGREEGREEQAIAFVTRLLTRRLKQDLSEETRSRISTLSLPMLETLGEALLDFANLADLQVWLDENSVSDRDR